MNSSPMLSKSLSAWSKTGNTTTALMTRHVQQCSCGWSWSSIQKQKSIRKCFRCRWTPLTVWAFWAITTHLIERERASTKTARQARQGCYRRWRRVCAGGLKKSLRHHPQGHNNTSSHARDEVYTMLQLRRAAVVCLLIPNFLALRICGSSADSFWQCLSLLSRFTHVRASRRLWFFRTPSSVVEAKK